MKHILTLPIKNEDIEKLHIGDVIYVTGTIATARDEGHVRVVEEGVKPSIDLNGGCVFHAGPIMKKNEKNEWVVVSVGPTTSMRMEKTEEDFMEKTGVKLLIGKGGMGDKTALACKKNKVIHTVIPGGCAVLEACMVEKVEGVDWLDLGMPEAFWILKVKEFGPLVVTIDIEGNNLFKDRRSEIGNNKELVLKDVKSKIK